jgi:putative protease
MRAKRLHPQMEICGSFLFDIINVEQLQFFKALNVSLVELSPQLTIGEIAQLSKNSPIKLGLVGHLNCAAFEGACYIDHFIDYENEILPIGLPCKGNFKLDNGKGLTKEGTWLDSTLSCSLCNIVSLMDCKIEYLKIPGRHIDYSLILEWTKVYRYVIDYVKNTPNKSKEELHKKILGKFPNWRLWCRLNRKKGCLYDEDNQIARFYVGK